MYYYITTDNVLVKSSKIITSPNFTSLTEEQYNQYFIDLIKEEGE